MRVVSLLSLLIVLGASTASAQESQSQQANVAAKQAAEAADQAAEAADQAAEAAKRAARVARVHQANTRRSLSFFLLGNINGRLVDIDCRRDDPVANGGLHYARQAALWRQLVDRAQTPADEPIALNLGDSTFPGALPRYLLASEEGAVDFAATLKQIPYRAHAIGDGDLGMERAQLLNFVNATARVELPLQAANLACNDEGGAEAICEVVGTGPNGKPWQIVERDGLEVGVVTVLDPDVQKSIAKNRTSGLDFLDPAEMLAGVVQKARDEAQADLVVVLYHMVGDPQKDDAVELATKVPGIDVMFTNRLMQAPDKPAESSTNGHVVAPGTGTFIVGADSGYKNAVTVDLELAREAEDKPWKAQAIDSRLHNTDTIEPHQPTSKMLRDLAGLFCEDWGGPINPELELVHPYSRDDLQQFILNVMRFSTDSEVALVNQQTFVENGGFPIKDKLALADVFGFVPYKNKLVTVKVPGSVLAELAKKLDGQLVAAGLTKKGDKVLVNGRPIQTGRTYRVATHVFLASGGDDILPQDKIKDTTYYKPSWAAETPAIGTLVAEYVRTASFHEDAQVVEKLDPEASFPDLHRHFLWSYTGAINASFNKVSVDNPTVDGAGAYDQSQLNVNSTTQINLEGNGEIKADSRNHGWHNRLLIQYAQARVTPDPVDSAEPDFEETKDLIRLRSTYQYAGFRANTGGKWYVPMPFAELQAESEFSKPNERDWHKIELTGIGGAKFELFEPLEIKLGANARRDLNQPDAETTYGLNVGYTFDRTDLVELLGSPIQFESELEYFYNDIGSSNIQEIRNMNRLYFALMDQLFFTTTFQAFLYRTDEVGQFGSNTELTVGLNYLWDATVQSF